MRLLLIKLVFTFLFITQWCLPVIYGQSGSVLWHKKSNSTIELKWYKADNQYYADGCNVYRKINDLPWEKVNSTLIRKQDFLSPELIKKDSSLLLFANIFEQVPVYEIDGFLMVNLIVKSFESNEFSKFLGNYYQDVLPTHEPITTISYKVVYSKYGKEVLITQTDEINLLEPTNQTSIDLVVDQKNKKFKFSWMPDDDLFYAINLYKRKAGAGEFTKVNKLPIMASQESTTDEISYRYEDADVDKNSTYEYFIQGLGYFENETAKSKIIKVSIIDTVGPPPAYNLKRILHKDGSLAFTWENPEEALYTKVNLYTSTTSDGTFTLVKSKEIKKGVNNLSLKSFSHGTHYFQLKTFDQSGNSTKSNTVFINIPDLIAPDKPQNLILKADTGRIVLNWNPNNEADLMGYYVYRSFSTDDANKFILMNGEAISTTQLIDSLPLNLKNNIYYKVLAVDSSYNKSLPSKIKYTQLPDAAAPNPPFINKVINKNDGNDINWYASTTEDANGYNIFRSVNDSSEFAKVNHTKIDVNTTVFRDSNIEGGIIYTYYIQTYDSAGNSSAPSNKYSVKTKYISLKDKIVLTFQVDRKRNQTILNWTAKEKKNLLGFIVFRKEKDKPYRPLTKLTLNNSFLDLKLEESKVYTYQIKGYYKGGFISSSNEVGLK